MDMTRKSVRSHPIGAAVALLCCTLLGNAVLAASANIGIGAEVVVPLTVAADKPLSFGSFLAAGSGQVVVSPGGARSGAGGVTLSGQGAASGAAALTVNGSGGHAYSIVLPPSVSVKTAGPGANASMEVDGFLPASDGLPLASSGGSFIGKLGPGGTQVLGVGATLHVKNGQAPGLYAGTCGVTVDYQ